MRNIPVVNAPNWYINGLNVAWASNKTVTITQGVCRDNLNQTDIVVGTLNPEIPLWIQPAITIDGTIVGPNGMDRAPIANNGRYAVHVIADSTKNNPVAGLMGPSSNIPILPLGYDSFRRVGYAGADGSANLKKTYQYGQGMYVSTYYDVPITVLTGGSATTFTAINLQGLSNPYPSVPVEAYLKVLYTPASAGNIAEFLPFGSTATNGHVVFGCGVAAAQQGMITVVSAGGPGSSSILYRVTNAGDSLTLAVAGFKDYRYGPQ